MLRIPDRWRSQQALAIGAAVLAVALVVAISLALRRGPRLERRPGPERPAPVAPQFDPNLAGRYAKEPVISLFVHETGQRREIPLEEYLLGVAAAERSGNMPPQALQALVIAARTITLFNKEDPQAPSRLIDKADACTSPDHFQAYAPDKVDDAVRQAVGATRGQVLVYQGKFIYAAFSALAGGKTATAAEAFGGTAHAEPYLQSVDSPVPAAAPPEDRSWSVTVSKSELFRAVGAKGGGSVQIVSRGPSGRVLSVRIGGRQISGVDLRAMLGGSRLRSTLITGVQDLGDRVTFSGRGWGHGAGLDQWGAHGLALRGWKAAQILAHYYPGTALYRLYP